MAFTEFCCRSGGSNLNSGTRTGDSTEPGTAAFKTYVSGTWVQATRTFTPAGGANPVTDGIAVGDFVSVYPDAATVSPYVARITTVGATTFVTSATAFAGTAPVDGALVTSASIGGAWKGPNAAENFPFGFMVVALTNVAADLPRVNLKNNATYNITAGISNSLVNTSFQGYTTAYGDFGRTTVDGGTSGASYVLLTASGSGQLLVDLIFQNNGSTGSAAGVSITGSAIQISRCVANNVCGHGFTSTSNGQSFFDECEAYAVNKNNTASQAGFNSTASNSNFNKCIAHDNPGTTNGFRDTSTFGGVYINCVADTNGAEGLIVTSVLFFVLGCDFYNNASDGLRFSPGVQRGAYIENSNFVKNGGYGINLSGGTRLGLILNCGFGSGSQANTSGVTNALTGVQVIGSVTYAADVTPWVDPANGDFRINLAAAQGTGRGTFTETAPSYTGTIGYPDIGAAQHLDSGGTIIIGIIGD